MELKDQVEHFLENLTEEDKEKFYCLAALIAEQMLREEKARKRERKKQKRASHGKNGKDKVGIGSPSCCAYGGHATVNVYDNVHTSTSIRTAPQSTTEFSTESDFTKGVLQIAKSIGDIFSMFT